jgi:hypothetical protein
MVLVAGVLTFCVFYGVLYWLSERLPAQPETEQEIDSFDVELPVNRRKGTQ